MKTFTVIFVLIMAIITTPISASIVIFKIANAVADSFLELIKKQTDDL